MKKNILLLEWLHDADKTTIEKTGVSFSYLRLIAYGHKQPSAKVATLIEQATQGAVTRKVLRPDDWWLIWPELSSTQEATA